MQASDGLGGLAFREIGYGLITDVEGKSAFRGDCFHGTNSLSATTRAAKTIQNKITLMEMPALPLLLRFSRIAFH